MTKRTCDLCNRKMTRSDPGSFYVDFDDGGSVRVSVLGGDICPTCQSKLFVEIESKESQE